MVKNIEMDGDGGRQITKSIKAMYYDVITEPMHSKEENEPILIGVRLMKLCFKIAIPPPRIEIGLP